MQEIDFFFFFFTKTSSRGVLRKWTYCSTIKHFFAFWGLFFCMCLFEAGVCLNRIYKRVIRIYELRTIWNSYTTIIYICMFVFAKYSRSTLKVTGLKKGQFLLITWSITRDFKNVSMKKLPVDSSCWLFDTRYLPYLVTII